MHESSKKIPLQKYPAQRIALIKPSALGDIAHSLPVLSALRQRYPSAHITWIVNRSYEPLLQGHPDLNATLPFDRKLAGSGPWKMLKTYGEFLQRERAARFDLVIDLQGLLRTGLMAWFSGAPRRIGLATAREGSRLFYTDVIHTENLKSLHAVDRYWEVVKALGAGEQPIRFHVPIHPGALAWAKKTLSSLPRPWLVFGVGARWLTKRWRVEHFAYLANKAQQHFGGTIVFVGSGDETPLSQYAGAQLDGPVCDLTGLTNLPQLAALLSLADVMVANDSGPTHLAVALGRPVVIPYTCTRIQLHGPYGQFGRAVETSVWCRGSYLKKCSRLECMCELTPDRLWPLLEEVLWAWQKNQCA